MNRMISGLVYVDILLNFYYNPVRDNGSDITQLYVAAGKPQLAIS